MANTQKTVMVTGGSQAIGAGLVKAFLHRGYSVVANSRNITKSGAFEASDQLASVDGSIAEAVTAAKIAEVARSRFQFIDALLNNAGIYFSKRLMDYTIDDLRSLFSVRVNAVAPGTVNTPMHKDHPKDFLKTLQPMGRIVGVKDIVDAIVYLTEAGQVSGRWRARWQMLIRWAPCPSGIKQRLKQIGLKLLTPLEPFGVYSVAM